MTKKSVAVIYGAYVNYPKDGTAYAEIKIVVQKPDNMSVYDFEQVMIKLYPHDTIELIDLNTISNSKKWTID